MNPNNDLQSTINKTADKAQGLAQQAGDKAQSLANQAGNKTDDLLLNAKRFTSDAAEKIEDGIDSLRDTVPSTFTRAAAKAEDYARLGIERARQAGGTVKEQAQKTGDYAVAYVKDEPMKAMIIAAAAGALTAMLVTLLTRSPRDSRY